MSISLKKNSDISLSKETEKLGLTLMNISVGLGWDCNESGGATFDLDAWALVIGEGASKPSNLVYFGNKIDTSKCIHHLGDSLTGKGDGDDEVITLDLENMPSTYEHIIVGVTIHRAQAKKQSFADVHNAFIRVFDTKSGIEVCKYDVKFNNKFRDYSTILFGAFSRVNGQWQFNAIGSDSFQGFKCIQGFYLV